MLKINHEEKSNFYTMKKTSKKQKSQNKQKKINVKRNIIDAWRSIEKYEN